MKVTATVLTVVVFGVMLVEAASLVCIAASSLVVAGKAIQKDIDEDEQRKPMGAGGVG